MESSLLTKLQTYFTPRTEILFAYLFGSQAAGTANSTSDVDIAVFYACPELLGNADFYLQMLTDLSELLRREVDLVVLNTAPPFLKSRVINCRQTIICRDTYREGEFITSSLWEYFDVQPYQELGHRRIIEKLKEEVHTNGRP